MAFTGNHYELEICMADCIKMESRVAEKRGGEIEKIEETEA